jgi:hypothetical protein
MTELTNEQIDSIVEAAEASVPEDGIDMRAIKEEVQVDPDAELESDDFISGIDDVELIGPDDIEGDASIFDQEDDEDTKEKIANKTTETAKDEFNLTDLESLQFIECIKNYQNNKDYPVYPNLPEPVKKKIRDTAFEYGMPYSAWEDVAKMLMDEAISDAKVDDAFVDFQASLNDALNVPSVSDLYFNNTRSVFEEKIPETVESIKDEFPEKAELLLKVKDSFTKSYTLSMAREQYENNTRLRKALRRYDREFKRSLDEFNFRNEKSKFRMNDVRELPLVLKKVLITDKGIILTDEEGNKIEGDHPLLHIEVSYEDIQKLCILLTRSCENMNPHDVVDASYMYYMMRNIIALKFANEAKTPFAAELISNICDTISFIRQKEAEFNGNHLDERKRSNRKHKHNNN